MFARFVMTKHLVPVIVFFAMTVPELFAADFTAVSGKTNWTQRVSFHCDETPLSGLLVSLGSAYHFTFFLDRRIDPDMLVVFQQSERPLIEALAESIESLDLSWCVLQSHIYIGPPDAAGKLLLSCAIMRHAYTKAGAKFSGLARVSTLEGEQFCQPRALLERLAREAGLSWNGLDRMPLDCWNAFFVSPLSLAEQMQLILVGFGVCFELEEEQGRLKPVPLDDDREIVREYLAKDVSPEMQTSFPQCRFDSVHGRLGAMIRVTGPFAELARWEWELSRSRMKSRIAESSSVSGTVSRKDRVSGGASSRKGRKEMTGTVENKTLEDVFAAISPVFGVKFKLDESLAARGITVKTRISCKFDRSGLKSVLDTIAAELNAEHRRTGEDVVFLAK